MERLVLVIVSWRKMNEKQHQHIFDDTIRKFVGATGADTIGEKWAAAHNIPTQIFKPEWRNANGVYDKAAGVKRNSDIVNACTHMIAFPSDEGKGTQDSIRKAKLQCKIVVKVKI